MSDFTVYEDIISNGEEWLTRDNANDLIVATFAYPVDMQEVRELRPDAVAAWEKVLDSETFAAGDELHHEFASLVRHVAEEKAYGEYKRYTHANKLPDPVRNIRVVINNPNCLPDAEERRRQHSRELGLYIGRLLGLGKR